jgi:2-(1,2-epoxy-1,2-dihydrophenyl)acetyl-CoA isomerase
LLLFFKKEGLPSNRIEAMNYEHILFEDANGLATLTINRPSVMNALSTQTLQEMIHALDRVRDEGNARALLLSGTGRAFCTGADLSSASFLNPADMGASLEAYFNPLLERFRGLPIPFVSAVNGAAVGGGCAYALAADIAIAARSAYFLQPFAAIGLVPDVGSTWLLPRLAGRARATAMMMLGERIPAETALDWGLIYKVVDDAELMQSARSIALRLAAGPTAAYRLMRAGIDAAADMTLTEALAMERNNQRDAGRTADHTEGVTAFLKKRKPVFHGK